MIGVFVVQPTEMPPTFTWIDGFVLIAALWGAGLSTYQEWRRRRAEIPRARVDVSIQRLGYSHQYQKVILVEIVNVGDRSIFVAEGPTLLVKGSKPHDMRPIGPTIDCDRDFPSELLPGTKSSCWFARKQMALELEYRSVVGHVGVIFEFRDQTGRKYCSKKPLHIPVAEWKNLPDWPDNVDDDSFDLR
jgi:hypothetical protein